MRHLAAYLLLVAGGNEAPTADDISTLLGTVGIEVSDERLTALITELEGKNVNELISLGSTKLSTIGGGSGGGGAPAAAAPVAAGGAPAAESKVEEKAKPKEEEVDALDGGMDMFGGGGGGGGDY